MTLPRYLPDVPFPPYTFVPGVGPHPRSDPRGHSHGESPESAAPVDADDWRSSRAYLRGIDLFNHGYYWEAHEVWEMLWLAHGRKGAIADFLKALIQLAAAGVKAKEGIAEGVRRHALRAAELLHQESEGRLLGMDIARLLRFAGEEAPLGKPMAERNAVPEQVWSFTLELE
ncbi:hypothetical protein AYO40_03770 [Planctomycetaceae bacterium SCGC AG-212-D15]|nr:hypothetical protein AYO40_03770 [Planctomycetaceae bacterium SCGC AG-212-D15]